MPAQERSFDWRVPAVWAVLLTVSVITRSYVAVIDEGRRGNVIGLGEPLVFEITSHLVIVALLPALYWLQRRWRVRLRANAWSAGTATISPAAASGSWAAAASCRPGSRCRRW